LVEFMNFEGFTRINNLSMNNLATGRIQV
jgi:hypothetical protein